MQKFLKGFALCLAVLMAAVPARAQSADPAAQTVQKFYDALLDSMKNAQSLGIKGRYDRLTPAVRAAYDLETMTGLSVGPAAWSGLSAEDKKALTDAFERLTVSSYAANFDGFSGEKFTVDPNVDARGNDKFVKSVLVPSRGAPVPFIYRMRQSGGNWKIIDVLLNGEVSQLAMRRADFSAAFQAGGAKGLVKKIDELADKALAK